MLFQIRMNKTTFKIIILNEMQVLTDRNDGLITIISITYFLFIFQLSIYYLFIISFIP